MAEAQSKKERELLDALTRIGNAWGLNRQGLIVSFNGARVGTWTWSQGKMMVKPEEDDFKKAVKRLNKNGITTAVPAPNIETEGDEDLVFTGPAIALETTPLNQAAPGLLDHALKLEGYYLIDLNLPIAREE